MLPLALSLWHCDLQQSFSASLWVSVNSLEPFQDPTQSKAVGEEARRKNGTNLKMLFDLLAPRRKSQVDSLLKSSFRIDDVLPSPQNETGIRTCVFQLSNNLSFSFFWLIILACEWGDTRGVLTGSSLQTSLLSVAGQGFKSL